MKEKLITFQQFADEKKISRQYVYILELKKLIDVIEIAGRKFIIYNEKAKNFKAKKP